jgi:uncharacterized protein YutE (UPF0331/DUF86 family)
VNEDAIDELATLERMAKKWKDQGFEVYLEPVGSIVPPFLERYKPDAILVRGNEKIVVEIVRKGQPHLEKKIDQIQSLFLGQRDWQFEVVYAGEQVDSVPHVKKSVILSTLDSSNSLVEVDARASLLLLWASLEAVARNFFERQTTRPQSPGRIVELLAGSGNITPSEAKLLRRLVQARNSVIHGELNTSIEIDDVILMQSIVTNLAQEISEK